MLSYQNRFTRSYSSSSAAPLSSSQLYGVSHPCPITIDSSRSFAFPTHTHRRPPYHSRPIHPTAFPILVFLFFPRRSFLRPALSAILLLPLSSSQLSVCWRTRQMLWPFDTESFSLFSDRTVIQLLLCATRNNYRDAAENLTLF